MEEPVDEIKYILKWNSHNSIIANNVSEHLSAEELCDVTLSCEGKFIRAHKLILSAASEYFKLVFNYHKDKHPVIIMTNTRFEYIQYIIDYIYKGEVKLLSSEIESILKLANDLQIKGLYGVLKKNIQDLTNNKTIQTSTLKKSEDFNKTQISCDKKTSLDTQRSISTSPTPLKEEKMSPEITHDVNSECGKKREIETNMNQNDDSTIISKKRKVAEPQKQPKERHKPTILRQIQPRPNKVTDVTKPKDTLNKSSQPVTNPTDTQNACPNVSEKNTLLSSESSDTQNACPNVSVKNTLLSGGSCVTQNACPKEGKNVAVFFQANQILKSEVMTPLVPLKPKILLCLPPKVQCGSNSTDTQNGSTQNATNPSPTCDQTISNNENPTDDRETKPLTLKIVSAFMLFAEEHRPKVSSEYPGESFKQISLRLSKMWKNLPNKEKDSFYEAASRENEKVKMKLKN